MIPQEQRVAFIGISNWALDPAKMNRGVMVTRQDPDIDELVLTARGICRDIERGENKITSLLKPLLRPLAEAYMEICRKQQTEFFGLRDFYWYVSSPVKK